MILGLISEWALIACAITLWLVTYDKLDDILRVLNRILKRMEEK